MNNSDREKLYNYLLENGELFKICSKMTGDWEKDKEKFTREQEELEELTRDFEI
jgi:hypothetical protein